VAWGAGFYGQTDLPAGSVEDLGLGLAGSTGVPLLWGSLECLPGGAPALTLTLGNALPNSTTTLVLGLTEIDLPFKGGTLVPSPAVLVYGLPTGLFGTLPLAGSLPASTPSGFGLSASNGLSITTP
jgi:hypothetical protein